jgi:integrase/recombinase XerC
MQLQTAIKLFLLSYRGSKSPETEKRYGRKLANLVGFLGEHMSIERVTIHDLREWRAGLLERGYSDHTLHGFVRACRHFWKWLEGEGILDHDPALRLELPRLPRGGVRGIQHDDLSKILAVAVSSPRDLALCWFLYSTGCRVGGLCDLRLGDLRLDAARAYVREKNKKARVVFLVPQAVEAMRAYLAQRPAGPDDHVWLGQRGPLKTSGAYQALERLAQAAGVERGWNPHAWRHTRAREFQAELGLGIVSQLMGHASEQITADIYGRLSDDELQRLFSRVTVSPGDS